MRKGKSASETDDFIRPQTKILVNKVADVAMTSPFVVDPHTNETPEVIMNLLERGISHPALWLHSRHSLAKEQSDRDATLLDRLAPHADTLLAVPIWRSDGCPSYILLLGWSHAPTCKPEIENFVESMLRNCQGLVMLRQAKLMAQAQIAFSNVQIHELRTHLHQLSNATQLLRSSQQSTWTMEAESSFDIIEVSTRRITAAVENILSYFEDQAIHQTDDKSMEANALKRILRPARSLEQAVGDLVSSWTEIDIQNRRTVGETDTHIEVVLEISRFHISSTS